MKATGTDVDLRNKETSARIEMYAFRGDCKYCGGVVMIFRDLKTFELKPDECQCMLCGQPYFVDVGTSVEDWELNQGIQKEAER